MEYAFWNYCKYRNYTIEMHGNCTEIMASFNIQVTIERVVTYGQQCM